MLDKIDKVIAWIMYSSQDPKKTSLTVKMALVGFGAVFFNFTTTLCGFGLMCLGVTETDLNTVIEIFTQAVYLGLQLVAVLGALYGAIRKVWKTLEGTNSVFAYYFGDE